MRLLWNNQSVLLHRGIGQLGVKIKFVGIILDPKINRAEIIIKNVNEIKFNAVTFQRDCLLNENLISASQMNNNIKEIDQKKLVSGSCGLVVTLVSLTWTIRAKETFEYTLTAKKIAIRRRVVNVIKRFLEEI